MNKRAVSLVKGGHRYLFTYGPESESHVIDEIMRLAEDPGCNLDWLDAATLGFQVARDAADECCKALQAPSHVHRQ
jgi:hypothetical protein